MTLYICDAYTSNRNLFYEPNLNRIIIEGAKAKNRFQLGNKVLGRFALFSYEQKIPCCFTPQVTIETIDIERWTVIASVLLFFAYPEGVLTLFCNT